MDYRKCTNPRTVHAESDEIKFCFDRGYKLACLPQSSFDKRTAPQEWVYQYGNDRHAYIIYKDEVTLRIFREVVDALLHRPRTYFLNELGDNNLTADIINGFFFGYCFVEIAEYVLVERDDMVLRRVETLVENVLNDENNKNPGYIESKANVIKRISTCKKGIGRTLVSVFDEINRVAKEILKRLDAHRKNYNMNCRVIHNIRIAASFYGDCYMNDPTQNYNSVLNDDDSDDS